jgi:valyl-tRNA synthetase
MRGKSVFYPVGWDDNGLPTERRVQSYFGVRCDPSLPYDPQFTPPREGEPPGGSGRAGRSAGAAAREQVPVSRRTFVELCQRLVQADERAYMDAWRRLGLSVDWSISYQTIDDRARAVSQRAFLRNVARGEAYLAEAPSLWDVTFGTAVAQAELEDREVAGSYLRIAFGRQEGPPGAPDAEDVVVATTRPELLAACVALVAHPDDERYAGLAGTTVRTPLFGVDVPVLAHRLADPAKGTGIAMVCTFGDTTDVTWWRELRLATRPVIGRDGRLLDGPLPWLTSAVAQDAYRQLAGLTAKQARARVTGLLRSGGATRGEPEPVTHAVKFYEKGDAPLEIVTTRQWYIRNGSGDPRLREVLLARGRELSWHPPHMRGRYEDWVNGLAGDWLVSRQRYFGVPIPVWYPLDDAGQPRYDSPITPPGEMLPADPAADPPPGYDQAQRGQPRGFTADPDVLDTWATSSVTPEIAATAAGDAGGIGRRVFPMDLRSQAHEIIRTWLFYTVLRSELDSGELPWRHAAISGWILDPDRKKMSKSRGNVSTPEELLREYGSDAMRYWAASARLGVDATFDAGQLRIGRRLALKILNASRFVLGISAAGPAPGGEQEARITEPLDQAMLGRLAGVVARCTEAFEAYDHAQALELAERFFWYFCDDYLELVKPRAYGGSGAAGAGSATGALQLALSVQLRLFAPFLPFVTEEVWSWREQAGSVHRSPWPEQEPLRAIAADAGEGLLDAASGAIGAIRKAKSQAQLPMRASVRRLVVTAAGADLSAHAAVLADVLAAGSVQAAELRAAGVPEPSYEVAL